MTSATTETKPVHGKVGVGDAAPDFELTDTTGKTVRLSELWADQPLTVVFLRHFGCVFCREQVALIRREYQKLLAAGTKVVCIANGPYKAGRAFEIYFDLPFPVLVSDDTAPFAAYGLEKATIGELLSPKMVVAGLAALFRGHIQGKVIGDPTQMPGAFVIDTAGTIRYAHRNRDAADHAKVADILAALAAMRASGS